MGLSERLKENRGAAWFISGRCGRKIKYYTAVYFEMGDGKGSARP